MKNREVLAYTKKTVLIDTWWNVNMFADLGLVPHFTVLIDTWWNVNYIRRSSERTASAF